MPRISENDFNYIISLLKDIKSLDIKKEQIERAEQESNHYLENKELNTNEIIPLTIYYIIKKLSPTEQVDFIRTNIDYIKQNEENIFLYHLFSPEPLAYNLSYEAFKEISYLDKDITKNILNNSFEELVNGFSHKDYMELYELYYEEISKLSNIYFINMLGLHSHILYHDKSIFDLSENKDILERYNKQKEYNIDFMKYILKKYQTKINSFNHEELLEFIDKIDDINLYQKFINDNKEKLERAFLGVDDLKLSFKIRNINYEKQKILIQLFFDSIIKTRDISTMIYGLAPEIIISLYKNNNILFKDITLLRYIEIFSDKNYFNDELKTILDKFELDNIEILYTTEEKINSIYSRKSPKILTYIENKYRTSIKHIQELEPIDENTSIFSNKYFNNLNCLKYLLKNNKITRENTHYQLHLDKLINYLLTKKIITIEEKDHYQIEILFYRIVMGLNLTTLYKLKNLKDITLLNRLGNVDFNTNNFTINQLENYNVKNHKKLYEKYKEQAFLEYYKIYTLKLMLIIGYRNTLNLLQINDNFNVLEHLIGNIDIEKITIDKNGEPTLNKKIMNLLFNDKNYSKIKIMLDNLDNDLYKYFPRIFNEWDGIVANNRHKSLASVIDFLKATDLALPPKYYRLNGEFKHIGCSAKKVNETLYLHDKIIERTYSTIPKISGTYDEYDYELLDLQDMSAISVGSKTNCCFTVLGNGYSCLKHAVTSINGRVLVVRKNNELIAHSWVWRNGNLLCLDNIEISKKLKKIDFLDLYLKFANEVLNKSFVHEGTKECLKNITIGLNCQDNNIEKIEKFPCILSKNIFTTKYQNSYIKEKNNPQKLILDNLPQPLEEVTYSDSKNCQYLIRGQGNIEFYQSSYYYQDNRNNVLYYENIEDYSDSYLELIEKKLNALIYTKYEEEGLLNKYKYINITDMKEVYCNDDWFIITKRDDTTLEYIKSSDNRSIEEMKKVLKSKSKKRVITKVS